MINALPKSKALLADQGYDAEWFRTALAERGITACIPPKANCKVPTPLDIVLYRQCHRIENMFANSKTGGASTPATTDAPALSCPPSALPQPSSSGSIHES